MSTLKDISIGIKTFLRDDKLFHTIGAIRKTMPEAQMIIADDGETTKEKDGLYAELIREGHQIIILPFDSGFGKKSNAITASLARDFLLVGSDDFSFSPPNVVVGIKKMLAVLDQVPQLSIVSGRLANRGPYEFFLLDGGDVVEEVPILSERFPGFQRPPGCYDCDVTVNYSLVRREVFGKVRFDDEEIIGEGGHGAFFYDVKKAGLKVVYVPGVEISEQTGRDSDRYRRYRNRACGPSRKCFEKRGIRKWVLGSGQVDYDVTGEQK